MVTQLGGKKKGERAESKKEGFWGEDMGGEGPSGIIP